MTPEQQAFLENLARRIPRLFAAIGDGNVRSEYIIGVRRIDTRQVRLKLVAEVVDSGANPLATHSSLAVVDAVTSTPVASPATAPFDDH